jgi:hypothetical protein
MDLPAFADITVLRSSIEVHFESFNFSNILSNYLQQANSDISRIPNNAPNQLTSQDQGN